MSVDPEIPGVRAELVRRDLAVDRRRVIAALEVLGLDHRTVAAVRIETDLSVTVIYRQPTATGEPRRTTNPILDLQEDTHG